MSTATNITVLERGKAKESLLAFLFDDSGVPEVVDECQNLKDSLALLNFARVVIERKSLEITEEIMRRGRNVA